MAVTPANVPLIIPVENQLRELDSKLLLACVAAGRGFTCILGSHRNIDLRIASLPRSLYLCKSFTARNLAMFRIMDRLGHRIVSWDEEALVHLPAEMYFARRLSPASLKYVSDLFAWGEDNAGLWRRYPSMPRDKPIHVTGNPRGDLLRADIRSVYAPEAERLRRKYGNYILVNTNFNHVNAFFVRQNLFRRTRKEYAQADMGKAARGMSLDFAEALRSHKQALFDHFRALIPMLDRVFSDCTIIVRPHPTENPRAYEQLARTCRRVKIISDGNVVPWLMAAKVLVHNGCTTAVEAYSINTPAISYRPSLDENIDETFYYLPNQLSHQCFSDADVLEAAGAILRGVSPTIRTRQRERIFRRYVEAQTGPLACERIVGILETIAANGVPSAPSLHRRITGSAEAGVRRVVKRAQQYLPGSHAPPAFHRHRYPGITAAELGRRVGCFRRLLDGNKTELKIECIADQVFRISA